MIKLLAQRDHGALQVALLQRENEILRRRLESLASQHRPHYAPEDRFAILQLMRLRHWSVERAAERFVLHPNTVRAWLKEFTQSRNTGNFFGAPPFNKIGEGVHWLVHQIRELCPEPGFGSRQIAMALVRGSIQISRSSVQRILRRKKPKRPPMPAARKRPVLPHHMLRPTEINRTWHLDLTTLEFFWIRFYVAAVIDGFSRKLLMLRVYRDAPSTDDMARLIRRCTHACGAPHFLITDHGCQFRTRFERRMKREIGIDVVKGCKDSKRFDGKVERFFRTFKLWQRLTLFAWTLPTIPRKLDVYRDWYNTERPMWLHGGRTPDEVWRGTPLPAAAPVHENDPLKPAVSVWREHFRGDHNLPKLAVVIVRSVQCAA